MTKKEASSGKKSTVYIEYYCSYCEIEYFLGIKGFTEAMNESWLDEDTSCKITGSIATIPVCPWCEDATCVKDITNPVVTYDLR